MNDLRRRLTVAEKRVLGRGGESDAKLVAVLTEGDFNGQDLDRLYRIIHEPMRAAVLAIASTSSGTGCGLPPVPVAQLAMIVAYPKWRPDPFCPDIPSEMLKQCWDALAVPEHERHPEIIHEYDKRYRAHRGLLQRLVQHHGIDALREELVQYPSHDQADWPVPVLSDGDAHRLCRLVDAIGLWDKTLVLWRGQDGFLCQPTRPL